MTSAFEEDRLPWLEAVDDEAGPRGVSSRKMLAALVIILIAAAIVAGTFFLLGSRGTPVATVPGEPELIKAPDTPYKVKPDNPGGLDVAGDSETAFATSAGVDRDARLAGDREPAAPEPAATPAVAPPKPEPKRLPPNEVKEPVKPEPAAPPRATGGGSIIQLGAYASTAKANIAWSMLTKRFPSVAALGKQVETASVGGKTVYRLRASGAPGATREACAALQAGGENCIVVK